MILILLCNDINEMIMWNNINDIINVLILILMYYY